MSFRLKHYFCTLCTSTLEYCLMQRSMHAISSLDGAGSWEGLFGNKADEAVYSQGHIHLRGFGGDSKVNGRKQTELIQEIQTFSDGHRDLPCLQPGEKNLRHCKLLPSSPQCTAPWVSSPVFSADGKLRLREAALPQWCRSGPGLHLNIHKRVSLNICLCLSKPLSSGHST